MGMVTLVVLLAAVSALVCLAIDREGDIGPPIRGQAVRMARGLSAALVRSARAASDGLLTADELLRQHRRAAAIRPQSRPGAVAVDSRPSRLIAFIELLMVAALTGAAIAVATVGLAWAVAQGLT
jgi:hypothetical protein